MNRPLILTLLLLPVSVRTSAQVTYTLTDCYKTAMKNNVTILRAQNQVYTDIINRRTAQYNLLPSVSYNMGHYISFGKNIDYSTNTFVNERFSGGHLGLGLQLNIFSGFSSIYAVKQSAYLLQSSSFAKKRAELEVFSSITLQYMTLLSNKEQAAIARSNILSTARELEIVDEKIKVGRLSKYERHIFSARLSTEQANLITFNTDSSAAIQELKQLLNLPLKQEMEIAGLDSAAITEIAAFQVSPGDFVAQMLEKHPAIKEAKLNEQSAFMAERMARSSLFPSLSVGGNLVSNYRGNLTNQAGEKIGWGKQIDANTGKNINFSLRIPIFSQMKNANRVKREQINVSNARLEIQEAESRVVTSTLRLINEFNAARQKYLASLSAWEGNKLYYSMYEEKYKLGMVNPLELITAKDLLNTSSLKYVQAKIELYLRYQLLQLLKEQ